MKSIKLIFALFIPLLILLISFNSVAFDKDIYKEQFAKEGFHKQYPEAKITAYNILGYIQGCGELNNPYLNQKEQIHLKDVKFLVIAGRIISLILIIALIITIIYLIKTKKHELLISSMTLGGITSIVVTALIILLCLLCFDQFFVIFHKILFRNDLWLMNPVEDVLTNLFSPELFKELAIKIFSVSFIVSLMLIILPQLTKKCCHTSTRQR